MKVAQLAETRTVEKQDDIETPVRALWLVISHCVVGTVRQQSKRCAHDCRH